MQNYWAMKTFLELWDIFQRENIIGIDQDGVDRDYNLLRDPDIQALLADASLHDRYTEFKDRVFREFCKWMQHGDLVIIGTGALTTFNVSGIARVLPERDGGNYQFDPNHEPRHFRRIEMLAAPHPARPMQRFPRTSRLELIGEIDFYEALISMI